MPQRPRRRHFVPSLTPALLALWFTCYNATAQPTTAPAQQWELSAHGSASRLWYGVTTPLSVGGPDRHTFIRTREAQGKWEALVDFPSRLTAMSDADGRLIVALADGEWKRVTPEQFLGGPPLPGDGEMFSLTGGAEGEIWCVGMGAAAPSTPATTRASTQPSISTRPAAAVAPGLFRLTSGGWQHVAPLPGGALDHAARQLSLAWIDKSPTLAYPSAPDAVRVSQWRESQWSPLGELKPGFALRKLALLNVEGKLAVWAAGEQGPGTLFIRDATGGPWQSRPLKVGGEIAPIDVALAAFHGELRLLAITGDERLYEQRFDVNAAPVGPWRELDQPPPPQGVTLGDLLSWGGLAILMVITLATANHGGIVQVAVVNKIRLPLAPLSLRLAAGLIDLWPFYIAPYVTFGRLHEGLKLSQLSDDTFAYWTLGATLLLYFLHTAIAEAVWGRSFGKMFVGLRVLSLNGDKPSLGAILLRNLIRVIEVPIGVPLLMILLNPLRQRFGDFFASTVVTRKLPRELQEKLD